MLGDVAAALTESGHATGWGYRYGLPHVMALAMRGDVVEADAALNALEARHRPFRSLHYERSLARARVAAGCGAVSEAVTTVTSAAQKARQVGQYAAEVLCLQTAAQFGDSTGASRLAELETKVQGPRACCPRPCTARRRRWVDSAASRRETARNRVKKRRFASARRNQDGLEYTRAGVINTAARCSSRITRS